MLPFFNRKNSTKLESNDLRLRAVEWKVNLILVLIGIQLAMSGLILVRQYLIPSTTTLVLCSVAVAVFIWLFRNQIPGLVKRMIFRQVVSGDSHSRNSPESQMEDSIK